MAGQAIVTPLPRGEAGQARGYSNSQPTNTTATEGRQLKVESRRDFLGLRHRGVAAFDSRLAGAPIKVDRLVLKTMLVRGQAQEFVVSGKNQAAEPQPPTR